MKEFIINKVNNDGVFYINSLNQRENYISNNEIKETWLNFTKNRKLNINESNILFDNLYFISTLFSLLPFVEKEKTNEVMLITLKEYRTDELPSENLINVIEFLDEVIEGRYNTTNLNSDFNKSVLRVLQSRRQDLRLIGFLNETNELNEPLIEKYIKSENKYEFIQKLIINQRYFYDILICLDLLKDFHQKEKTRVLEEIGKLLVRNSTGDNLMVDSVAKKRTHNLLIWLEMTNLIDDQWNPKKSFCFQNGEKELIMVDGIRQGLLKVMNKYVNAKKESPKGHELGRIIRNEIPKVINNLPFIDEERYITTGSIGVGNWAYVPWIAVMKRLITVSTQRGYYIVYLFSEDMKRVYLTLAQGVTETSREEMLRMKDEIRQSIPNESKVKKDDEIYLGESNKARDYALSTAVYVQYDYNNMPDEKQLIADLEEMVSIYENFISIKNSSISTRYEGDIMSDVPQDLTREKAEYLSYKDLIQHIHSFIKGKGFNYEKEEIKNLFLSLKSKPFVIISGISGTGKTKIVQWFAESVGATDKNGQFSLIPIRPDWNDGSDLLGYVDIKGEFKEGPLTKVILKAKCNPDRPYFVLLDEMNLARVEYYFSDILSVMESRKWNDNKIVSSTLLSGDIIGEDLTLPNNIYIIGTVNMDETTHPFSKKVLDRANTIEFNRVDLSNLAFLADLEEVEAKVIGQDRFSSKYLHLKDVYQQHKDLVERATNELVEINQALQLINAHVGYRVRDEICFYLAYNEESDLMSYEKAFDHCILQKILPRVAGSDSRVEQLLTDLYRQFTNKEYEGEREDFTHDIEGARYPRSAAKVAEMLRRLEDGFTSFWIS